MKKIIAALCISAFFLSTAFTVSAASYGAKVVIGSASNKSKSKARSKAKEKAKKKCQRNNKKRTMKAKWTKCIKIGNKHHCQHSALCFYKKK